MPSYRPSGRARGGFRRLESKRGLARGLCPSFIALGALEALGNFHYRRTFRRSHLLGSLLATTARSISRL